MSKLTGKFKDAFKAESYLFKLLLKTNGWLGLIIISITLINRLWYLTASFIDKRLLDEIVNIYTTKAITAAIFILIGMQLGGKILNNLLSVVGEILEEHTQNKATLFLDKEVMHRMVDMDSDYFDDPKNRDAITAASQSKATVSESIGWSVSMVTSVIGFITSAITFFAMMPLLGLLFLATYIPGTIVEINNSKRMRSFSINNIPENRKKDYYRSLLTSGHTAKDIRLYHLEEYFKNIYNCLWKDIRRKRYKVFQAGAIRAFSASLLTTIGIIAIIVYCVYAIMNGIMTIGEMSLYISLALGTGASFKLMLNQLLGHFQYCIPEVNKFLDFITHKGTASCLGTNDVDVNSPSIEFRNVSFKYPGCEGYALNNISFKIESAEKIALLGINGSGKTTLVKLLLRFYKPESGKILINGKNIWDYSKETYSKLFGTCFQEINHYALTMRENIALSRIKRCDDDVEIASAAKASGADRIASELDGGYNTELTREFQDNGAELSGGQWQKIAIARAFFSDAPIIILDEPSSALDPQAEDEIFGSFKTLCENKSGILISHRLSGTMLVDKIVLIENGKLLECGTHHELMNRNGRYAELYNMQASKYISGKETV